MLAYAGQETGYRNNAFTLKNSKKQLGYQFMNKSPMAKNNLMKNTDLIEGDEEILALSPPLGRAALKQSSAQKFVTNKGGNGN